MNIYIITYFCLLYEEITKSKRSLHILQETNYNDNNSYLKWLKHNIKDSFFHIDVLCLLFIFIGLFTTDSISKILCILSSIIAILDTEIFKYTIMLESKKGSLVYTKRVIRQIITLSIINMLPLIISNIKISLLIESIFLVFNYFLVYIVKLINNPIEYIIYYKYYKSAAKKLNNYNKLDVIAITGSCGKTSTKNILNNILKTKYDTYATPKNINTEIGLIKTINDDLPNKTDIFITEAEGYSKGKIKKISKLIHPKYVLITSLKEIHLDVFSNINNIINTRFELIDSIDKNGILFLNMDDPYQVNYKIKKDIKVIWYSLYNKKADIYAKDIKINNKGSTFKIYIKKEKKEYFLETKLLGRGNISNIVGSIAIGITLGVPIIDIIKSIKDINPLEDRLSIKYEDGIYKIMDKCSYSMESFNIALEVLSKMKGTKIVVTPGILDLGDKDKETNLLVGHLLSNICDYVILVRDNLYLYKGLIDNGYSKDKIMYVNEIEQSINIIKKIKKDKDIYVLYESNIKDINNRK